jgi:hypothetical protein
MNLRLENLLFADLERLLRDRGAALVACADLRSLLKQTIRKMLDVA